MSTDQNDNQIPDFSNFTEHSTVPPQEQPSVDTIEATPSTPLAKPLTNTKMAVAIAGVCLIAGIIILQLVLTAQTRKPRPVPPLETPKTTPTKRAK